jgi:hypothetical protein
MYAAVVDTGIADAVAGLPPEEFDWMQAVELEEEAVYQQAMDEVYDLAPSAFTEFAFYLPHKGNYKHFSFEGRPYLRQIYDTPTDRRLLMAGRQVEKSTLLGNQTLSYCCMNAGFKALYVSPSNTQTKVFSKDRVQEPIETSPFLKAFTNTKLTSNILENKFVNRSQLTLRFAFLNADRCRGIPSDYILIDEFQDILLENIPVIEECNSHSAYKMFTYAGTPKSLDNSIEHYWSRYSTQNEWVVPCKRHGTPKDPSSWHWNILDEDNIGLEGLICDACGEQINASDPDCQWAQLNPTPKTSRPFEGFRIPQLMVPWIDWDEILDKYENYGRAQFFNEVLGRSYDSGTKPLTQADITQCCNERLSMSHFRKVMKRWSASIPIFMGVDWGTGEDDSFTLVVLGAYLPFDPDHFTIFYAKRFTGAASDPREQMEIIKELIEYFNVAHVGVDYGGGHYPNDELLRAFGAGKLHKYQWVGNVKKKISFDPKLGTPRFLCHRTEIMSDLFNAIKRGDVFRFPRWAEWEDPFALDMLNIFSEFNERLRMNIYKRGPGMPDDTFHAICFCFLASMFYKKRADVILPQKTVYREPTPEDDELDITSHQYVPPN